MHGIPFTFGKMTERIVNRTGTGYCPMESAVLTTDDVERGYSLLKEKLAALRAAND